MKSLITSILLLFVVLLPASASAADPNQFSHFASKPGYEYIYISPEMLKILGNQIIDNGAFGNISLRANQIKSVEVLQTSSNAQDDELWVVIRKVKENNKLKTLSTKQNSSERSDILGTLSANGKFLSKLMIVSQKGSKSVSMVYLTGDIPIESIQFAFQGM